MIKCTEKSLTDVARVDAYPVGSVGCKFPLFVPVLVAGASDVTLPNISAAVSIPFSSGSLKVKDAFDLDVSMNHHTVTLEFDCDASSASALSVIEALSMEPHEIVITYFGGVRRLIRTDDTAYKFAFEEGDGVKNCTMTLVNGQGLVLLS